MGCTCSPTERPIVMSNMLMSQVCDPTARAPGNRSSRTRYIATARARHEISVPWRSLDRTSAGTGAVFLYGGVEVIRGTLSLGTFVAYQRRIPIAGVEQEFRDFLQCGWLAGGFARFRC